MCINTTGRFGFKWYLKFWVPVTCNWPLMSQMTTELYHSCYQIIQYWIFHTYTAEKFVLERLEDGTAANASFIDLVGLLPRDVDGNGSSAVEELARPRPPRPRPPRRLLSPRPRDGRRDPLPRPRAGLADETFLVSLSSSTSKSSRFTSASSSSRGSPSGLLERTRLITSCTSLSSCFTFFRRSSLNRCTSTVTVSSVALRFFKYTYTNTRTELEPTCCQQTFKANFWDINVHNKKSRVYFLYPGKFHCKYLLKNGNNSHESSNLNLINTQSLATQWSPIRNSRTKTCIKRKNDRKVACVSCEQLLDQFRGQKVKITGIITNFK